MKEKDFKVHEIKTERFKNLFGLMWNIKMEFYHINGLNIEIKIEYNSASYPDTDMIYSLEDIYQLAKT